MPSTYTTPLLEVSQLAAVHASALKCSQIAEHIVRERVDVADRVRLADHAVRVDEVRDPLGEVDLVRAWIA
jgi:hypothetical protein